MSRCFVELCEQLFDIAGLPPSEPEQHDSGGMVMTFELDGVQLQLMCSADGAEHVFSRVNFGPAVATGNGREEDVWGELLEANFSLFHLDAPHFSRDPWVGTVVLQQRWPGHVAPQALLEALTQHCHLALDWQSGRLAAPAVVIPRGSLLDPRDVDEVMQPERLLA